MSKLVVPILVVVVVIAGAAYLLRPQKQTLGEAPQVAAANKAPTAPVQVTPIGELTKEHVGKTVRIEGVIEKECPHTGCWAIVKDATGSIRIDTNKGGFTLPLRREGSKIAVTGTVEQKDNGDLEISAMSADLG